RARVGGVDDVVDLEELGGVHRRGVLLGERGELPDATLALLLVGDRLELAPHAEPDRALEPHRTEVRAGPRDGEDRLVERPADHRLRAEAVTATEDDRDDGDRERAG